MTWNFLEYVEEKTIYLLFVSDMNAFIKTDHFFTPCILLAKSVKKLPCFVLLFNYSTPSLYVEVQYVKIRS